jgi:hypothetical protein
MTRTPTGTATRTATSSYTGTITTSITPTWTQTFMPDSEEYRIEDMVIYPNPYNPGDEDLKISFKVTQKSKMIKVRIFTTGYRLIKQITFADKTYNAGVINKIEIPDKYFRSLANGAYYLIVYARNFKGEEVRNKPETLLIIR